MTDLLTARDHFKPFAYPFAFEAYRAMASMRWEPDEVPLAKDVDDWNKVLTPQERNLLTQLFRFFTQGDVDVATAYRDRYMPAFKHPEIAMALYEIASAEANHVYAYSRLLDTVGMPEVEYQAFQSFAEMKAKHDYLFKKHDRFNSLNGLAMDIAVFSAFSEGMQLFSSFAMLMNFQRRGLMQGMSTIIEWSIRDESQHVDFMIRLFHELIKENPTIWTDAFKARIYQTCRDMVELEDHFIDLAFEQGAIEGMSAADVKTYIRYIADRRLNQLGLKANYGIDKNPFEWLDWLVSAPTHTNFFEQRSSEYSKGSIEGWDNAYASHDSVAGEKRIIYPGTEFIIVSKPGCPYCALAKHLLRGQTVHERVLATQEERTKFNAEEGTSTYPQVFYVAHSSVKAVRIGGADSLQAYLSLEK